MPLLRLLRRRPLRGQSLAELAIILPILCGLAGGATDLARAYQAWLTLESASRNAAEYVATTTSITDSTSALAAAKTVVCTETSTIPGYQAGAGSNPCTAPSVTVVAFSVSTTAPGATQKNPIASAEIRVSVQFRTLVPWPFLPNQAITLTSDRSFSIVRGRN